MKSGWLQTKGRSRLLKSALKHVETQTAHISVALRKSELLLNYPCRRWNASNSWWTLWREIARIKVYEETPDVQKQAFVREEISVRKEVEQVTVDVEDKIRREELDLDIQDANVVDETKTL